MTRKQVRPMMLAASAGRLSELKALLQKGADPTSQDNRTSAVHLAAINGRTEVLTLLASAGANLDVLDYNESTPLMAACASGLEKGSRGALKLIQLGANVKYIRKSDGAHALDLAAVRANPEVLEALVRFGAAVDERRKDPITPLMRAALENNLPAVKVLLALGADRSRKCTLAWGKGMTAAELATEFKKTATAKLLSS